MSLALQTTNGKVEKKTVAKKKTKATNKIDRDLVKEWITALESGKYKKCKKILRTGKEFCAFGVLCDVYDPDLWVRHVDRFYYEIVDVYNRFNPPVKYLDKIGMDEETQEFILDLNDKKNKSFKEIAQYLREKYNIKD